MFTKSILAAAAVAALLIPDLSVAQANMAERLAPGQPPVIAATGRIRDAGVPDDSLAGLQWAMDRGVDMIAVRVRLTGDGHYIVLNEGVLTRATNVRDVFPDGAPSRDPGDMVARMHIVTDYTLEEIKRLRLLDRQGGDHPVPTVDEALDLIDGRVPVVLVLEDYDVDSLAALLEPRDPESLLLFDRVDLPKLRAVTSATGIGAWGSVVDEYKPKAAFADLIDRFGSELKIVDIKSSMLTPEVLALAQEHGVRLGVLGVVWEDLSLQGGNTAPWQEALDSEAAVFWTEYPDTVLGLLGR